MSIPRWLNILRRTRKSRNRIPHKHQFRTERLEDRLLLATFTWDGITNAGGATANSSWTTATNWVGDVAPSANDDLVFPAGPVLLSSINNFANGTDFGSIVIGGSNYNISGNSVDLVGGISSIGSGNTFGLNVKLLNSQGVSNSSSGTLTVNGQIDLNGNNLNVTTSNSSGTTLLGKSISGTGNLVSAGGGKTVLAASNSYTGTTTVSEGTLSVSNAQGLGTTDGTSGTGTVVTNSGAIIQLVNGITVTNELLTSAAATSLHFSSIGTNVWAGDIVSGGSVFLEPTTGNTLQVNGNITADGSGFSTLRVNGSGKVILNGAASGANIHSFDVLSGLAEVNGSIQTLNGNYDTNAGTISGVGTVGWGSADIKQIFGTINPGTLSGPGVLNYGNVSFQTGSNFNVWINGTSPGTGYDQLGVTGSVSLAGNLNFSLGSLPVTLGAFYTILNNDGADAITGTFTGLAENSTLTVGSQMFRISYVGGDGNDVVLEALTGSVAVNGTTSNDSLNLRRDGSLIELRNGSTLIYSSPLASIQASGLMINGDAGDDTLTIDYAAGGFFALPVIFNGETPTTSNPGDRLIVHGGVFTEVVSNYFSATEGNLSLDTGSESAVVSHFGVESIDLTGSSANLLILDLPAGINVATLEDDGTVGNNHSRLSGSTITTTVFANPTDSLEIRPGSTTDKLFVDAIPDLNSSLKFGSTSDRFQSIEFNGAVSLASGRTLNANSQLIETRAPLTTAGGEIGLHATGDITITRPILSNGGVQNLTADSDGDGNGTLSLKFILGDLVDPNRAGGNEFGASILILSSGNIVVTSPFDDAGGTNAGAVYVFDSTKGSIVSVIRGSGPNNQIGSGGLRALSNGNFVILSPNWDNGALSDVGAVTWANGVTGVSGVVSTANSLVGSRLNDRVGTNVVALANGNYLALAPNWDNETVADVGAVTWGNGATGIIGVVSQANSLVGSSSGDQIGSSSVSLLSNGNYVVNSPNWDGSVSNVGAVTWGSGSFAVTGVVSAGNSLVGSSSGDQFGLHSGGAGVTALNNGNYVVTNPIWDNGMAVDAGSVTWGNGAVGSFGVVGATNSVVGSSTNDLVGGGGVRALTNGNYVIASPNWDNGIETNVGAVTWVNGLVGLSGNVDGGNSLVGTISEDLVGSGGTTALTNGNYVVRSPDWDNGAVSNVGSVTWGNGVVGTTGPVGTINSLIGSLSGDKVGSGSVSFLANGNYVVNSPLWNASRGAATWGNGSLGITGVVSAANSLVGSLANSQVGSGGATALTNGNYVVSSPNWGGIVGAATWGDGVMGTVGVVGIDNSLVGNRTDNRVSIGGIRALTNGNYVVSSPYWDEPTGEAFAGAVTWGNGASGISGLVSRSNSLVGNSFGYNVGLGGVTPLTNGNYVVQSPFWGPGKVGAVTWGNGSTGLVGVVSSSNSLVGSFSNENLGFNLLALSNGNYVVTGRGVTWANGTTGIAGEINEGNSILGNPSVFPLVSSANSEIFISRFSSFSKIVVLSQTFGIAPTTPLLESDNAAINISTANITLLANVSSDTTVSLGSSVPNRPITLGGQTSGTLALPDHALDRISAGTLKIGSPTSGQITISSAASRPASTDLVFQSPAGIVVNSGVNLNSGGGSISPAGSNLLVTGTVTGPITIPNGSLLRGTGSVGAVKVENGGVVAPGASPGILNSGNIEFDPGSNFDLELNGLSVGTQYDQLNVTGSVTLNEANLNLSLGFVPVSGATFVIINNDGADAISGSLHFRVNGLVIPDGGWFLIGGTRFVIDYSAGSNNNDVVLTIQNYVLDVSLSNGNLVVNEISGNTNDSLTLSRVGGNVRLTDQNNAIRAGQGGTQVSGYIVEFPFADITGSITIHGAGGSDDLSVDFSGGNPISNGGLVFHGGVSSSMPGDTLQLLGGNHHLVTYSHTNGNEGQIVSGNYGSIFFTGIESHTNTGTTGDLIVNLSVGATNGFLTDDGIIGNGLSLLKAGTDIVPMFFSNPLDALEIRPGNSNSKFIIETAPEFASSILLGSGSNRFQSIEFNGAVNLASSKSLNAFAQTISTRAPLTTSGGEIGLFAIADIIVTKPILSSGGIQTLTADSDGDGNGSLKLEFFNAQLVDPNPAVGNQFGVTAVILNSGNIVVTSPFDDAGGTDAGAVYLFDGVSGTLISTLRGGSANDRIGSGGIAVLSNGNYVIKSPLWDNVGNVDAGAATWGNATSGIAGVVNSGNSIVGSNAGDQVGSLVTPLSNGNYVISSPGWNNGAVTDVGAVTWANGVTGNSGVVSTGNSLVGSVSGDQVGQVVTALTNGNYVVGSPFWNNGPTADVGATTWANGTLGFIGVVSGSNSLIGSRASDRIGAAVRALTNGNFVTSSSVWDDGSTSDVGAVTWGRGTTGIVGVVSGSNSLVGSNTNDRVSNGGIVLLPNGNYVVSSLNWNINFGAVTWGNGNSGVVSSVSSSNSLVGPALSNLGNGGIIVLSNGNFVVNSPQWRTSSTLNLGAVTLVNAATGMVGDVSSSNSLVGSTNEDRVGSGGIVPFPNGNFVVRSPIWNGTAVDVGAVTWVNGVTGRVGPVSSSNSLVGATANEKLGEQTIKVLTNGNYVVVSPLWDNGAVQDAGAATWANGVTGISGVVGTANSMVGNTASSRVGSNGVVALSNGNYVVSSSGWNGSRGAATWGNGNAGTVGIVSASNSLVGNTSIQVGIGGIYGLANGNYVVSSPSWDSSRGAVTWGNGLTGVVGLVSGSNSLVGSTANDRIGNLGITALTNGNYVVSSQNWDNGTLTDVGAVTWVNGSNPMVGVVNVNNSLVGNLANDRISSGGVTALANGNYLFKSPLWDSLTATDVGAISWANGNESSAGILNVNNSVFGNAPNSGSTIQVDLISNSDKFMIRFPNETSGYLGLGRQSSGLGASNGIISSGNANIYLSSAHLELESSVNSDNSVFLASQQSNRPINLGTDSNGSLSLGDEELDRISTPSLYFGNTTSGPIVVSASINRTVSTGLVFQSPAGITISNGVDLNSAGGTISPLTSVMTVLGSVSGPITVPNGSQLKGTGVVGPISVENGGSVAAGASPGILHSSDVVFSGGSNFAVELNGTTPGNLYDQLNVSGLVTLDGPNLQINLGFVPVNGDTFTIINNDGTDAVLGAGFKVNGVAIPDGGTFMLGGTRFLIDYSAGSDSNDVVLTTANISVQEAYLYYKGSGFHSAFGISGAIDPINDGANPDGKDLLRSNSSQQTTSLANVSNYSKGINGFVMDVDHLSTSQLAASDFIFRRPERLLPSGLTNPSYWSGVVPAPTSIQVSALSGTRSRVVIEWADNLIENTWLQVVLKANSNTGLTAPVVHYLGHAYGEVTGMSASVDSADLAAVQGAMGAGSVPISNLFDINKDQFVDSLDAALIQKFMNKRTILNNITIPAAGSISEGGWSERVRHSAGGSRGNNASTGRGSNLGSNPLPDVKSSTGFSASGDSISRSLFPGSRTYGISPEGDSSSAEAELSAGRSISPIDFSDDRSSMESKKFTAAHFEQSSSAKEIDQVFQDFEALDFEALDFV